MTASYNQVVGYIRVSTNLQRESADTQRYEILKLADLRKVTVNEWVIETVSGTKAASERKLGDLMSRLRKGDLLIVADISRLGRSLMDIMNTLHMLMNKGVCLSTCKERYDMDDSINSKVLAFAFGLAAEIERRLISLRTKESLARKKSEGVRLGRPKGSHGRSMLDGKETAITEFIGKGVTKANIARIVGCAPGTLDSFIQTRNIPMEIIRKAVGE